MKLYRLGEIPGVETQAVYHGLAQQGEEGLVICRPSSRCVCLGLHDDLTQEIDEKYCRRQRIPLIRRDIGGGVVLLDKNQIFFQLVLAGNHPLLAGGRREDFFARFLRPVMATLADFGIKGSLRSPADIVVNGKKISGNGAGDIGGYAVFTGNILGSFDRETMSQILQVPSARFRELVKTSMDRYLTTIEEETGHLPAWERIEEQLIGHFRDWIGDLQPTAYPPTLNDYAQTVTKVLTSREFLELPGKLSPVRQIKINEGTYLRLNPVSGLCPGRVAGGEVCGRPVGAACLGQGILLVQEGVIKEFEISGIACLESSAASLANGLQGCPWQEAEVKAALTRWQKVNCDGVVPFSDEELVHWIIASGTNCGLPEK